jgi:endonuclease YncB( thermonuclease family)
MVGLTTKVLMKIFVNGWVLHCLESKYLHQETVFKRQGTGRYGRTLGTLFIGDKEINLLTIKEDYAWHFKRYSSDKQYAGAEIFARENKLGLWNLPNPIPPWNWRQK